VIGITVGDRGHRSRIEGAVIDMLAIDTLVQRLPRETEMSAGAEMTTDHLALHHREGTTEGGLQTTTMDGDTVGHDHPRDVAVIGVRDTTPRTICRFLNDHHKMCQRCKS
jgi:hypothetical protein